MSYVFVDITANRVERHHNGLQLAEMTAPATPGSGWGHLYAKSDGKIYFKNDSGTEYDLTPGGGAGVYQPLDSDLTTIAGLTATTDNFIVSVSSAWASRTPSQVKTTLNLNNVENTALSTWAGSANITTLGTITSGTWSATAIALNKITAVTASRALVSDGSGFMSASAVTATELGYLSGVTSAIQTQLDAKTGIVATITPLTAQAAAIAATTAYTTPGADGWYRINIMITVTQAATSSSTVGFQFRYTAAVDNVVKTWPTNNSNGLNQTNQNNTGATLNYSGVMFCKANTNIQYITSYTSSGATPMQYSVNITVEKL